MKRKIKAMQNIAIGSIGLGAMSSAGSAMGSPLVGNLTQGFGAMLPATGSILGAGMVIDSTKLLHPHWKRKRRR